MFNFFQTIIEKVISVGAGIIIAVGLVSVPVEIESVIKPQIQKIPIVNEIATTADQTLVEVEVENTEKIDEQDSLINELKTKVDDLERKVNQQETKSNEILKTVETKPTESMQEIKTFTTPSGTVLDESGNVISGPVKSASSITNTDITAGIKVLSGAEIYSLVSPSVVLIKRIDGAHGTGFIVEDGKYIITNAHVVGSDSEVTLTFKSGLSMSAPVLGKNDSVDLALIYNNNFSLKPVIFGSSDEASLRTGSDVYALGFPRFLENVVTLTKGLVSANRQQILSGSFIQTDTTIHGGNSGGPLVNNKGEVVGVNTSGIGEGGGGLEFAIPIETVKSWIPSLSQYGQNRYEIHPIGSQKTINRSIILRAGLNNHLSCSQLQFVEGDVILCNLYKNYNKDYQWNIIEDLKDYKNLIN